MLREGRERKIKREEDHLKEQKVEVNEAILETETGVCVCVCVCVCVRAHARAHDVS